MGSFSLSHVVVAIHFIADGSCVAKQCVSGASGLLEGVCLFGSGQVAERRSVTWEQRVCETWAPMSDASGVPTTVGSEGRRMADWDVRSESLLLGDLAYC